MTSKSEASGELIAKINFPLYGVEMLTDRHFVVAGGGGAAKTGVTNGFAIFQLTFNGEQCVANSIGNHNSGSKAIMNFACFEDHKGKKLLFAAGLDDHCQLYFISKKFEMARSLSYSDQNDNSEKNTEKTTRKRKTSAKGNPVPENKSLHTDKKEKLNQKQLRMFAIPMESVKTVKNHNVPQEEVYQKVVRISLNGKLMASGGSDGIISLWQFPSMKILREIKAHNKEIDDIDFSPDNQKLISVSRDGCAFIWYTKDGSKACALEWTPPPKTHYNFRRCRFCVGESENQRPRLFTIVNPVQPKHPSFLQLWDTSSFLLVKSVASTSSISELGVSPCGKFVAIGFLSSGGVNVYTSFNLQLIYRAENAHGNFITGLAFVPCHTETGQAITGQSEGAVISVSVDNQIRLHRIPHRPRLIPLWLAFVIIVLVVCLTFMLCSYFGL